MSALLARIGGASAAHPWRTIAAWLVVLVAGFGLSGAFGADPQDNYRVTGSDSQTGTDLLAQRFPGGGGTNARVVLHAPTGTLSPAQLAPVAARLAGLPHVIGVQPARMSGDGDTALFEVGYDVPVTAFAGSEAVDALESAVGPARQAGLQAELGGQVPENISAPDGSAEAIGILAALVVLVLAFGSVVAAGLPLAVALAGLGLGFAGIGLLGGVMDVSTTAPTVASMVGLGVGIDYALFLVVRFAEGLRAGATRVEAAARATATAGLSVLFAGTTVVLSLLGLKLAGLPTYASFGYATGLVVLSVMAASITLVPALCGLAGPRVLRKRDRAALAAGVVRTPVDPQETLTARWAAHVGRRPLPYAAGAVVLLLALAAPVLAMRTWPQDAGSQPGSSTTRRAYDLITAEFGAGANGPFVVVADLSRPGDDAAGLATRLRQEPGVAAVTPPVLDAAGRTAVLTVQPTTGPQDQATTELLHRLRAEVPAGTHITGLTAVFADLSQKLSDRLWWVVGFVAGLALLLLTVVFRSVVVAAKAAVMNLFSVAAAYGVMVAVFQWGWGATLLGLPHAVPVSSWVPVLMFAILFGLSMDYEVFLLSRIREDWLATGDAHGSVVRGLARTGRVISSAAAIMVAVFTGFALDPDVTVKMIGVGLAVAILVDATVVRLVLVPATMALLGRANWWLPGWLDRLLPHLDIEGPQATGRPADQPERELTAVR